MRRPPSRRCRRSPEEIAGILRDYDRSDLTQRAFVDSRGLSRASLTLWLRKAREGEKSESPRLVPVQLRDTGRAAFELVVPGGATVRIPADFNEDALRRLLGVLETRC